MSARSAPRSARLPLLQPPAPPAHPCCGPSSSLPSPRCISCASNRWTCQWVLRYHECREASPNPEDGIVRAHMVRGRGGLGVRGCPAMATWPLTSLPLQEDSCPQFLNPSPLVIPMNHRTEVTFQGRNLDTVKDTSLIVGSDLPKFEEPVKTLEPGTFFFQTPKVQLPGQAGCWASRVGPRGSPVTSGDEEAGVAGQAE